MKRSSDGDLAVVRITRVSVNSEVSTMRKLTVVRMKTVKEM